MLCQLLIGGGMELFSQSGEEIHLRADRLGKAQSFKSSQVWWPKQTQNRYRSEYAN